ncbi:Cof-type HAD-IIB family hydrolase [Sporosarcina sp. CAU 1771]
MKPHLIVLDLDGTLLTDAKTITHKTAQTLMQAKEQGHHIMIATGRPYRASERYYKELNLNTPIINFNGAFVHHPTNHSWQPVHKTLSLSVVQDVMEAMQQFPWNNIFAEVMDDVYMQIHDERMIDIFSTGKPKITTGEIRSHLKRDPTTLLIQADEHNVDAICKHLSHVHAEVVGHRVWNSPWGHVVEVFQHGLSKAAGLAHVSKTIDIPRDRIIAFGDENNDFEMIDFAGLGVAMGNGIDELKSIADEVTLSNNEDGIAKVLRERLHLN